MPPGDGGWEPIWAPSPIAFREGWPVPRAMSTAEIKQVTQAFAAAARRLFEAGGKIAEIHAAHGYLLHEFLSPLSNDRDDEYGGSFGNRTRFVREVVDAVRGVWPERLPLWVRLSATDWTDGGWTIEDSVALAAQLGERGVDLIDCSTGGNVAQAAIPLGPGYQVPFAERIPSSAQLRLRAARAFVETHAARGDVWLVGASRGAVDDLARAIAASSGATIGLHRFSLTQLALHLAGPVLASQGLAPVTYLGSEAVAARATFDAQKDEALRSLAASRPHTRISARARADAAGVAPRAGVRRSLRNAAVGRPGPGGTAGAIRRSILRGPRHRSRPTLRSRGTGGGGFVITRAGTSAVRCADRVAVEFEFIRALIRPPTSDARPPVLMTALPLSATSRRFQKLATLGLTPEIIEQEGDTNLVALRRYLFEKSEPPERTATGDVRFFSAPGEGRECVEIARRIMQEARNGDTLDEIAIFLRSSQRYVGLLEAALRRALPDEDGRSRAGFIAVPSVRPPPGARSWPYWIAPVKGCRRGDSLSISPWGRSPDKRKRHNPRRSCSRTRTNLPRPVPSAFSRTPRTTRRPTNHRSRKTRRSTATRLKGHCRSLEMGVVDRGVVGHRRRCRSLETAAIRARAEV